MKKISLVLSLVFILAALNPSSAQVHKRKHPVSTQNIFSVRFPKGASHTTLIAYMLGLAHPVIFVVKVNHGKLLTADIKEMGDPGNIRINQLFLPNGSSYEPFSHSLKFPISRKGTYKIIVGGSNMQGDDWKGAFTMRIGIQ